MSKNINHAISSINQYMENIRNLNSVLSIDNARDVYEEATVMMDSLRKDSKLRGYEQTRETIRSKLENIERRAMELTYNQRNSSF